MRRYVMVVILCLTGCAARPSATRPVVHMPPESDPAAWYALTPPAPRNEDDQRDADRAAVTVDRDRALAFLLSAGRFACPHVGDGNPELSTQVLAFQTILRQPDAPGAFASLLRRGDLAGQLYALCGLYLTDRPAFEKAAPRFLEDPRSVGVAEGCLTFPTPVRLVVRDPDPQTVRLAPKQALSDWEKGHTGPYHFDIVGGAYPRNFADARALNPEN